MWQQHTVNENRQGYDITIARDPFSTWKHMVYLFLAAIQTTCVHEPQILESKI